MKSKKNDYKNKILKSYILYQSKRLIYRCIFLKSKHLAKILSINGQISAAECQLLFDMASSLKFGCIVEIGSYQGKSTIALALGSKNNNNIPVYAIEPHVTFKGELGGDFGPRDRIEFFKNNLFTNVGDLVNLINLKSKDAVKSWNKDISLLWIDGDHSYKAVKKDFKLWEPYVINNGLICFHDSINQELGPFKIIKEILTLKKFKLYKKVDTITVLKKL